MAGLKLTGAEYNEFTTAEWGPGWYWDDTVFLHNGTEVDDIGVCHPTDEVVILAGTVFKGEERDAQAISAVAFARKWLKAREVTSLTTEVPHAAVEEFRALMDERGWKVLR